jgi:hypothetical protein
MGKHARIGLLLGASACLLAVMVDWVLEELRAHEQVELIVEEYEVTTTEAREPASGEAVPSESQAVG